jgi:hypothetical protein
MAWADPSKCWFWAGCRSWSVALTPAYRTVSPRRSRTRLRHRNRRTGHGERTVSRAHRVQVLTAVPSGAGQDVGWSGRHSHGRRGADGEQVMRLVDEHALMYSDRLSR